MAKNFKLRKPLALFMLMTILISNLSIDVYAETQSEERTSSMISFFRESRTGLDTGAVSKDELITYGVFISNFFIPGVTTVGDIGDVVQNSNNEEQEDGNDESSTPTNIATTISEGLFGSSDNKSEVQKINDKIYETLTNGFSSGNFDLSYRVDTEQGKLTGKKLLELMGNDSDVELLKADSNPVMTLQADAVNASFKVAYGVNPSFFLESGGLRDCGKLFIDGFGNIWAEPVVTTQDGVVRPSSIKTYKIVLPACLNPAVFGDGTKFPVVNSFVMGNILDINGSMFQSDSESVNILEPYYNIAKYLKVDDNCLNSMLNIYGIEGVELIGDSDGILKNEKELSESKYTNFLNSGSKGVRSSAGLMIAVNPDNTKTDSSLETIRKALDSITNSEKLRANILKYLNNSIVLDMNSISDEMTYFNFNWDGAYSVTDNSWSNINSPIIKNSLFSQSDSTSELLYYTDSYAFSTYLDVYNGRIAKDVVDNNDLLKGIFFGNPEYKDNKSLVEHRDLYQAIIKLAPNPKIGEILPRTKYSTLVKSDDNILNWFGSKQRFTVGYSLTENDNAVLVAETRLSSVTPVFSDNLASDVFSFGKGGGVILPTMTYSDMAHFRAYFNNFYNYKIFGIPHEVRDAISGNMAGDPAGSYKLASNIANDVNNWPGIFWGYMTDLLNIRQDGLNEDGSIKWANDSFSNNRLPDMPIKTTGGKLDLNASLGEGSSGLSADDNKTEEEMYKDILKKVYGILSPEDNEYRNNWIKATLDSWLISLHRSITGSWVGNVLSVSSGVTNSYSPVVGYINTPTLMDLPLTNWIMSNYMNIYVLFLLIVTMMLITMAIIGLRTIRNSVLIFMLLSVVLLLPNSLLNNSINFSNSITDSMFSDRFNYWAITQHQQNVTSLTEAQSQGNLIEIIQQNMSKAENTYSQDTGVKLKWMSPKKSEMFTTFFNQSLSNSSMSTNLTVFNWLFSNFFNQEEYVYGDNLTTYLYRPYNDIANSASKSYTDNVSNSTDLKTLGVALRDKQSTTLNVDDYEFKMVGKELNDPDLNVQYSDEQKQLIEYVRLHKIGGGSENYKGWFGKSDKITNKIFEEEYPFDTNAGLDEMTLQTSGGQEFLYLTESPFYYFYNALRDNYGSGSGTGLSFKEALLKEETFTVKGDLSTKVYNKKRDFLDMEGLFTNVVPYLNQANRYVINWIEIYGDDVPEYDFEEGTMGGTEDDKPLVSAFSKAKEKKTYLEQVWNLYSPWVDTIYDSDIYNKKVSFAKKNVRILDTLNPGAYDEVGRPMVWSEADMYAKNIRKFELTNTEVKIQEVLDKTYIDLMYLLNYYDFDDEVILTMSAMMATFNFNEVFSDNTVFKHSNMLYPQGFELKNFNYDAFMKMTLMNATGEPLMHNKDIYSRVLSKTSFVTGLLLIAEDIIAVMVIPTIKLLTMLLLVFLGLLLCVSCVVSPPDKILKMISKTLLIPIVLFTVCNIAFAYVVSTFVGEGMTYYTGSKLPTLATNDPTITILFLILAGCVYIFCMLKVLKVLFDTFKTVASGVIMTSLGIVAGAGMAILGSAKNKVSSAYRDHKGNRLAERRGKMIGDSMSKAMDKNAKSKGSTDGNPVSANKDGMVDANTSPTTDKALNKDINEILGKSKGKETEEGTQNETKKTFGQKAVDFKFKVKDGKDKVADTVFSTKDKVSSKVSETTDKLSEAKNYVTSAKMVSEAKGAIKGATTEIKNTPQKVLNKAVNSINDVRDYEKQVQLQRSDKLKAKIETKEKPSNLDMHRYGRENSRLSKVADKGRLKTTHSKMTALQSAKTA